MAPITSKLFNELVKSGTFPSSFNTEKTIFPFPFKLNGK